MHILLLPSDFPSSYFPEKTVFFRDLARALASFGHDVGVLALIAISVKYVLRQKKVDFGLEFYNQHGIDTFKFQYPYPVKSPRADRFIRYRLNRRVFEVYRREKGLPDIISAHGLPAAEQALWISRRTGVPYVYSEHSPVHYESKSPSFGERLSEVCSAAGARTAVSPKFAAHMHSLTRTPFIPLPNAVDCDFFSAESCAPSGPRPFTFVNVADLKENKNQRMLIESFAFVYRGNMNFRLLIVGDGAEYKRLRSLIAALGVKEQVGLLGHLNREEVRQVLCSSDFFLLASRRETFGVVLVEAMSCGLPVAAALADGPREIIKSSALGILFDNSHDALMRVLRSVPGMNFHPEVIRSHVLVRYSFPHVARRYTEVFEEVLAGGK